MQPLYDDVVTALKKHGLSVTEVLVLVTSTIGFIFFDAFVALSEEDIFEVVNYALLLVVLAAATLLVFALDVQYYYAISSVSGGEATIRLVCQDLQNNFLCLLRIFSCWLRYIIYDMQAEGLDMVFFYAESSNELALESDFLVGTLSNGAGLATGSL